jgi:hypothetical protein
MARGHRDAEIRGDSRMDIMAASMMRLKMGHPGKLPPVVAANG